MSTIAAEATIARKPLYTSLFVQVLVALLLGIVIGMAAPDFAIGLKIFSDAFLKLISMIVAPIVFCVVVHGIARVPATSRRSAGSASRRWSISKR
ncbi:Na+/H+-dicarboxylate symporter [Bradyrhizobium elkanii]